MLRASLRVSTVCATVLAISACATAPTPHSTYYESAYNDHNRAPASMSPPVNSEANPTVDPTYMRTQADYYFAMGEAQSLDGNRQKAIEAFKMTLVYDADAPTVRLRLATEYLKAGLLSEALEQAQESVKRTPENVEARLLLGGLHSAMKNYDLAAGEYEAVMKLDPMNNEAPTYLGAIYSEQKQSEKAVKMFESIAKNPEYPTPHLAWYYVGRVRLEQKDERAWKAAEKAFLKALELKPNHVDSVMALGSLYNKRKQEEKAIAFLAKWQREQGPSVRLAEVLSQIYIEKTKFDEAYEQLEILERGGEETLAPRMQMALILIEKKMFDKAIAKLEEILKEAPDSDKVRFYLAAVCEESKKDDDAIFHFRKITPESQYYAEAVVHSAYLLKGKGRLDEAISVVETGLKEKKDHPQMYMMYSSLLDEKGEFKKAASSLEGALAQFPDNAQLRFYYGTVQDRLGNKDRVIEEMKKVIELDPNHVQGLNYLAFTWAEDNTKLEDAEKLARRATELDPEDGYVLDTLGWVLYKKQRTSEAIRYLEAAHRAQPTVGVIAEHLGDAYMKLAMVQKAVEMYEKAIRFETDRMKIDEIKAKILAANDQRVPNQPARTPASR